MTDPTQDQNQQEDVESIDNMDQLAFLFSTWFDNAHAQAHVLLEVPDGQPITVQFEADQPAEQLILTGDMLKGFKAGLIVLTNIFGELPFNRVITVVEVTEDNGDLASEMAKLQAVSVQTVPSNEQPEKGN